jgi:tetratricopeptide (TPR) repeat protein
MAEILNHSGGMLRRLGHRVEAETKIREALAIQSRVFGESHIIVARTLGNLASSLMSSDRLSESLELHRRAEEIYQSEGIIDSYEYATHLHRYANTLRLANRCEEALSLERQSYEITRRVHGESHPETTNVRSLLAAIELTCGNPATAADMLKTVLESDRQELPDHHPTIARSAMNLASACFRAGRMEAALQYSEEAVERFEQVGPSAVELLKKAMALRSLMLLVDGQTPEAISTAEAAIELPCNSGQSNPSQLLAKTVRCAASLTIGDAQAAVVQLKKTTEQLESDAPQWSELAAIELTLQARWQLLEGNAYEAEQLREKALQILEQHFSKNTVFTQWAITFIAAPNRQFSGR